MREETKMTKNRIIKIACALAAVALLASCSTEITDLQNLKEKAKTVTLTFKADGGSWGGSTNDVTLIGREGAELTAPATPAKTGYTFSAWNPAVPATFPSADTTYTATWAKEGDYTITYSNMENAANSASNPAGYNVETATITLAPATKTGYTFEGWYSDSGLTAAVTQIAKGSTGAVTLYAKWTANTDTAYKVEHYQQNITDDNYTLAAGDTQNLTGTTGAQTAAAAKTYTGFTAQAVAQSAIAADGSTVVKLYYTRNIITLTFDLAGGTTTTPFTAATTTGGTLTGRYGAAVSIADPVKTGSAFAGWNSTVQTTFTADATYTAAWSSAGVAASITSSDITMSRSVSGRTVTFTAADGYAYTWYVDEAKQSGTANTLSLDTTEWAAGSYDITLYAVKNGVTYSAQMIIVVEGN